MTFEPLEIQGVIADEVGHPRNDGTPGCGLYRVPVRLSRRVSHDEAQYLTQLWDHPPQFTTMHRPGIAQVSGDVFTLDGTTVEEVRDVHARTLAVIVARFNEEVPKLVAQQEAREERARAERDAHDRNVADVAGYIRFE